MGLKSELNEKKEFFMLSVLEPLKRVGSLLEKVKTRSLTRKRKVKKTLDEIFNESCISLIKLDLEYPDTYSFNSFLTIAFNFASKPEKALFSDSSFLKEVRNELDSLTKAFEREIDIVVYRNLLYYLEKLEKQFDANIFFNNGPNKAGEWFYLLKLVSRKIETIREHCTNKIESQELNGCFEELNEHPHNLLEFGFFDDLGTVLSEYKKAIENLFSVIELGNREG